MPRTTLGRFSLSGPGPTGAGLRERPHPVDEVDPVPVVPEDGPPLDPAPHHMVEDPRGIEGGTARHAGRLPDVGADRTYI